MHAALQTWGGVVVHFSGVPPGVSSGLNLTFPDDLRHVINGHAQGGISCSTVRPGDRFEDDLQTRGRNSWGCIGVIVRGRTAWSLVCVDPYDCGSSMLPCGLRTCRQVDMDLAITEVARSLDARRPSDCNEWVMRDYEVLGMLIQPPFSARAFGQFSSREEIVAAFSGQPLYTIKPDGLFEVSPDFQLRRRVPISELYPCEPGEG